VVNQAFVRRYLDGRDPRGAHILDGPPDDPSTRRIEIVGVVPDGPVRDLREAVPPVIYRPLAQERTMGAALLVRAAGDPAALLPLLRRELAALEPTVPLFDAQPLAAHVAAASGRERMVALVGALFGLLALLVAALGLYALLTWFVLQQRREMAVRTVLGAARSQVRRMVLRRGLRLVAFGAALGVAGALALGRAVRGTLYGVGPGDPLALLLGASTLVLAALIACWAPARRAASVEPMAALKEP
jgi:predicted lysophospholipase L1 biosynthesis ABC-type transport system permease subunit